LPLQAQGEFALVKEELEPALELSGQPVKRGTMAHKHIVYMMLADAAAQSGDVSAARKYAALLEELATRDEHRPYQAVAHRAWGVVHRLEGDLEQADARLAQARELFDEEGAGWQLGRTLREMAELALAQEDLALARDYFTGALKAFETLEAKPDVERIRSALAAVD
jgi:tetratricopeptide (TPR) repeat protein